MRARARKKSEGVMTAGNPNWLIRMFGLRTRQQPAGRPGAPMLKMDRSPASGQPVLASDWQPGQTLLDDFAVEGLLGEGGMGKVYLVRSRSSHVAFAVKRAKGLGDAARRTFLTELQTWIDLPDHPNLVACCFFRTVDGEILIFAEYVEGGSLGDWIRSRKLYKGGPRQALERILDVAIQSAWGLQCLHQLGLVHQDVKPGNVLMAQGQSAGLQAKVTDYGLARARAARGERDLPRLGKSILVSSGGLTPAYCSPEQGKGLAVTRKTDIWSWGVSVLEMFTGEVTWASGQLATEALEGYLREPQDHSVMPAMPAMPAGVVEVLRRCFRSDPARRWASLSDIVDQLRAVYWTTSGVEYRRALAPVERENVERAGLTASETVAGFRWTDPRWWLAWALRAEGRDSAEVETIAANHAVSRRGELVADLATYSEARRTYERLVQEGHRELESDLADLCVEKALVHRAVGDVPGALAEYERAIEIQERLAHHEGTGEIAGRLAGTCVYKAITVSASGDNQAAVGLCDRAIALLDRLVDSEGQREWVDSLAWAYLIKATALVHLGNDRAGLGLLDRAIAIFQLSVRERGHPELANHLATAYTTKAVALRRLGDAEGAKELLDLAIGIWDRLVSQDGRLEFADGLASAYMNQAIAMNALGSHSAAVELQDRAIEIWDRLVQQEGQREVAGHLATALMQKANAVHALGDNRRAVGLHDQAIGTWERLVQQEGRRDLANDLARAYMNKAVAVSALRDYRAAERLYARAIEIRERLIRQEGRLELAGGLADAKAGRAVALIDLGEVAKGVIEGREAAETLRAEVDRTGSAHLQQVLKWLTAKLRPFQ